MDCASDRFCASFFLGSGRLYCTVQYCTMLYSTVQYCRGLQDTPSSINPPKVEPLRSKKPSTSIGKIVQHSLMIACKGPYSYISYGFASLLPSVQCSKTYTYLWALVSPKLLASGPSQKKKIQTKINLAISTK